MNKRRNSFILPAVWVCFGIIVLLLTGASKLQEYQRRKFEEKIEPLNAWCKEQGYDKVVDVYDFWSYTFYCEKSVATDGFGSSIQKSQTINKYKVLELVPELKRDIGESGIIIEDGD